MHQEHRRPVDPATGKTLNIPEDELDAYEQELRARIAARSTSRNAPPVVYIVALIGAALASVGSFMPWISASAGFFTFTKNGVDGDGKATLVAGILSAVLLLIAWLGQIGDGARIACLVAVILAGALCVLVAIVDGADAADRIATAERDSSLIHASVEAGLYLVGIGGALCGIAALVGVVKRS